MFDLKKPCPNCPFRKGQGELFQLGWERVLEIFNSAAFQCHRTVDYENFEDPIKRQGRAPQQCAGVMSILHRAKRPNTIMQVAERTGYARFDDLDHSCVYDTTEDALEAHSWHSDPAPTARRLITRAEPTRARMPNFRRAWQAPI